MLSCCFIHNATVRAQREAAAQAATTFHAQHACPHQQPTSKRQWNGAAHLCVRQPVGYSHGLVDAWVNCSGSRRRPGNHHMVSSSSAHALGACPKPWLEHAARCAHRTPSCACRRLRAYNNPDCRRALGNQAYHRRCGGVPSRRGPSGWRWAGWPLGRGRLEPAPPSPPAVGKCTAGLSSAQHCLQLRATTLLSTQDQEKQGHSRPRAQPRSSSVCMHLDSLPWCS